MSALRDTIAQAMIPAECNYEGHDFGWANEQWAYQAGYWRELADAALIALRDYTPSYAMKATHCRIERPGVGAVNFAEIIDLEWRAMFDAAIKEANG